MRRAVFSCPCGATIEADAVDLVALMNGHRCADGSAGQPAYVGSPGGGGDDVRTFTSSGTWTKPTGAPSTATVSFMAGGGGGVGGSNAGAGGAGDRLVIANLQGNTAQDLGGAA